MLDALLSTPRGGAYFANEEDPMTADEVQFWQDQAALLDPLAYEWVIGSAQSRTVTSGKHWYVVNAFWVQASSGHWFHRQADVAQAMQVPEGRVLTTKSGLSTSFMYLCKPELVVGVDVRYDDDPRGLYFERLSRLGELEQFTIGGANTGSTIVISTFPGDFTYGLVVGASSMHVAWTGLFVPAETAAMNTLNEISNVDGIAFAERCLFPFTRATFTKAGSQGVSDSEGNGVLTYVKLPGDW